MSEELQILYMQTRLIHLAASEWNMSVDEVIDCFSKNKVYDYISECWELFHVEGDEAVLSEISDYIRERGK